MRNFIITYESSACIFKGILHVQAMTVAQAQDKFFEWVKSQKTYPHLWQLSFELKEIKGSL